MPCLRGGAARLIVRPEQALKPSEKLDEGASNPLHGNAQEVFDLYQELGGVKYEPQRCPYDIVVF